MAIRRIGWAFVYEFAGAAAAAATWLATWFATYLALGFLGDSDATVHLRDWQFILFGAIAVLGYFLGELVLAGWSMPDAGPPFYAMVLAAIAIVPVVYLSRSPHVWTALAVCSAASFVCLCLPGKTPDWDFTDDLAWQSSWVGGAAICVLAIGIVVTTPSQANTGASSGNATNCSASYEPCVPDVEYDLDCPDVGHRVSVIGPDVYRLDANNDGEGCEWW